MTIFIQVNFIASNAKHKKSSTNSDQYAQAQPIIISHERKHQKIAQAKL